MDEHACNSDAAPARPRSADDSAEQLRTGGEAALGRLFERHRGRLWRRVNFRMDARLRGRVDPDDVLQEAYMAAAKRIDRFERDGFSSAFLWLRLVVQQTLIDVHRRHLGARQRDAARDRSMHRRGGTYAHATSVSVASFLVGNFTTPTQAAAREEAIEMVRQAVARMDPTDQEVLALRHFEELTNTEVAETLGIQPKAASIRYVRALRRLKNVLAEVPGMAEGRSDD